MPTRPTLALFALVFLSSVSGAVQPASAQMVPRMVSYPRTSTTVTPCTPDLQSPLFTRRTIHYDARSWIETTVTFAGADCSPESTLYALQIGGAYDAAQASHWTVAYRTITPTRIGAAYLQQQCGRYAWAAGVAQDVTADTCGAIALLRTVP
jgi:hypothetical protein